MTNDYISIFIYIILFILLIFVLAKLIKGNTSYKYDKISKIIFNNLDTVYILINSRTKKVVYLSNNVYEILGISANNMDDAYKKILGFDRIKEEIDKWNKTSGYISQMILYDNPRYNHDMWIKIKLFPYKEKEEKYYIIQIQDATKEHDSQHLLISQATNIKSRESQLNQITSKIYDAEISINLINNTYDLKYYNTNNLYFGAESKGKYSESINNLFKNINESDKSEILEQLSIESLNNHFDKYELESLTFRYRIGNEIKNNIWLESTVFFLSKKDKTISILTKNVTENAAEIRKQNVMLQNALNDAKMTDKSKTDLISTISHDIRTPLTNIIGLSDSLMGKKLDAEVKDDIKNIYESSNDVLEIIDSLLNPSKVEKEVLKQEEKEYNLLKLFNELEDTVKDYIQGKNIKVNLNLDNNLPVILLGYESRIKQALTKILNNSIKYTDEGEIDISVKGIKKNNNVNLKIEIKDTGIGMSEKKLVEIMNKDTNSISSVKKLIELLDGKFEIESKENEYTIVTLKFSQKIVEDNKIGKIIVNNKTAEIFDLSNKKILVVDDNLLNLKVTKKLLEEYKVSATLVESGEECLELIKSGSSFDLILMDQMMPGLNGLDTLKRLKQIDNFNSRVIVLTADAMEGQKEKYIKEGFDDYLSKPIDKKELSRVLRSIK